ncbi:PREDICTED: 2-hydroxyacyl-CoA lyase 1-like [Nicrophorus vespilloides]|uniref:2-hydroxyacyl-CoA lyase n=1 Tax=Nicrophorus vespilloides TaxID=110193 RepID=A0ABM1MGP6_NICVS|nr:PREDICTED: 2-hydroxyacyl-CoA lyase 1-like [Nicrophorus vespilloides]
MLQVRIEEPLPAQYTTPEIPVAYPDPALIEQAMKVLASAKRPLVIVGKGAAYARSERETNDLIGRSNLPFLATPMGKGVVSDLSPNFIGPARSMALQQADVVLLLGARLNWILHFGRSPRFNADVKVIQIDICPEELHNSVKSSVAIQSDLKPATKMLLEAIARSGFKFNDASDWWRDLRRKCESNRKGVQAMSMDVSTPLNYYAVFHHVQEMLPKDCIIVSEGANTMDIGRSMLLNRLPRHRLDAGTFGTMGVGLGFAIAAALYCRHHEPTKRVICVEGDSAFGFSGMELETIYRYKLPIVILVVNNSGIYGGVDEQLYNEIKDDSEPTTTIPPTILSTVTRYEKMMELFGKRGHLCKSIPELQKSLKECLADTQGPTMINVVISPTADRKPQTFAWLTESKL